MPWEVLDVVRGTLMSYGLKHSDVADKDSLFPHFLLFPVESHQRRGMVRDSHFKNEGFLSAGLFTSSALLCRMRSEVDDLQGSGFKTLLPIRAPGEL